MNISLFSKYERDYRNWEKEKVFILDVF